ncbi:hypothetical protein LIER_37578 [Lithospermum erythrorhizon]|uniref:RRM domain-containing protein n=1 Tax=Lithospermum erythrorhizon TaxID=34254 RepID=A0AAV3PM89_LITER
MIQEPNFIFLLKARPPHGLVYNIYCKSVSSSSLTEPNDADYSTSIIFVKGLPLSTSEGRLEMVFASFGDISRVKILSDKKTREPLGFAYIWFSSPASAQTAVKEMNGEFFDGRFISVMIARPGSCMPLPRSRPFKF